MSVVGADGKQETTVHAFARENVVSAVDQPRHVKVTALGFSTTSNGFGLGFRSEDIVVAPPGCHAVLIVQNEIQAKTAARLAKLVNQDCVVRR